MLSYRHAFHAGNHADVLKHAVLVLCLQYMKRKDKPFLYLDTHAGAGLYSLSDRFAEKTGEYKDGIARLWEQSSVPVALEDYLVCIRSENQNRLSIYPGSPAIARQLLREGDQLRLAEMHTSDLELLHQYLGADARVKISSGDGFEQIRALLPPASRRGLIMIDPSYEMKDDYRRVLQALQEALKRFVTGTYLIWYPLLNAPDSQRFSAQLKKLPGEKWLHVQLQVMAKPAGIGMYGSGMFVINPPYTLYQQLNSTMPWLVGQLGRDKKAGFVLEHGEATS